jgi:hypothetical protein
MEWAKLKFVHSIPGAHPIDLHLDHVPFISNISYKAISPYVCIAPGSHNLQIYYTEDLKEPFLDYDLDLQKGKEYTILVVGDIDDPRTPHITIYEDSKIKLQPGTAGVRFIHGASALTPIDLYNKNMLFLSGLEYDSRSGYYIFSTAEATSLVVTAQKSPELILGPLTIALKAGEFYTLIFTGIPRSVNMPLTSLLSNDSMSMCMTL